MNYQYAVAVKELNGITDYMGWGFSRTGKKGRMPLCHALGRVHLESIKKLKSTTSEKQKLKLTNAKKDC